MTRFLEILGSAGPVGAERVASTVAAPSESKPLNLLGLAALIASGPPIPTKLEFNPEDWAEVERAIGDDHVDIGVDADLADAVADRDARLRRDSDDDRLAGGAPETTEGHE